MSESKERIKKMRALCGLTRKDMTERFSISSNTLQCWESGRVKLSLKGAVKLSEAFTECGINCSSDWLLKGDDDILPIEMIVQSPELKLLQQTTSNSIFLTDIDFKFKGNAHLGWSLINMDDIEIGTTYVIFIDGCHITGKVIKIANNNITINCNNEQKTILKKNVNGIGSIQWLLLK